MDYKITIWPVKNRLATIQYTAHSTKEAKRIVGSFGSIPDIEVLCIKEVVKEELVANELVGMVKGRTLEHDCFEIYMDFNGKKRVHVLDYCWENCGRNRNGLDTPYTVTSFSGCDFPLSILLATDDREARRELWLDAEGGSSQYELDLTPEEFIDEGCDDVHYPAIDIMELDSDTPCGKYFMMW